MPGGSDRSSIARTAGTSWKPSAAAHRARGMVLEPQPRYPAGTGERVMPIDLDPRNTNSLWCSVLAETLVRCGVRHAIISPGSRSTALTMALVRHAQIEATPVVDERSAAFFGLGIAKRTCEPVALVCTSGTAAVNFHPAAVEAHHARVPLLVCTADRPPERLGNQGAHRGEEDGRVHAEHLHRHEGDLCGQRRIAEHALDGADLLLHAKPLHVHDLEASAHHMHPQALALARQVHVTSFVAVPLQTRTGTLGFLAGDREASACTVDDLSILATVAGHVASAIDNARAYSSLTELTQHLEQRILEGADLLRIEPFQAPADAVRAPKRLAGDVDRVPWMTPLNEVRVMPRASIPAALDGVQHSDEVLEGEEAELVEQWAEALVMAARRAAEAQPAARS